jgi:flagellar basal-body rod protein FlgB
MALNLDSYLGVHAQALTLEAQRTELLAANLANADTPNYKARDIDFKAALAAAGSDSGSGSGPGSTLALSTTNGAHLGASGVDASPPMPRDRRQSQVPRADGALRSTATPSIRSSSRPRLPRTRCDTRPRSPFSMRVSRN